MERQSISLLRAAGLALAITALGTTMLSAASAANVDSIDKGMLAEIQSHYGLTEKAAIERLASEIEAAESARYIEELGLESYAGSWFDPKSQSLKVAISDPADRAAVERFSASTVLVEHSLAQLRAMQRGALSGLENGLIRAGAVRRAYVDYQTNSVVVDVLPGRRDQAITALSSAGVDSSAVQVTEGGDAIKFTADVRGADGTRNDTWATQHGGVWPCSIGASIVEGYITAGHCGELNDDFETPSGTALGAMDGTSYTGTGFTNNEDGAWVDTVAGWTPKPKVNGYSDGIISINAKWAGLLSALVNGSVCRYGQTSQFPDCGTVEAKNVTIFVGGDQLDGMTEASGICTDDGDSGGPYLMATGQMQGTNSAGSPTNTCPTAADEVYFQPAATTLSRYNKIMLTTHGSNAPTFFDLSCEGTGFSNFFCTTGYNSQGDVAPSAIKWSMNSSVFDTGTTASGTCTGGQNNTVDIEATNTYGTDSDSTSFFCYSGSPP